MSSDNSTYSRSKPDGRAVVTGGTEKRNRYLSGTGNVPIGRVAFPLVARPTQVLLVAERMSRQAYRMSQAFFLGIAAIAVLVSMVLAMSHEPALRAELALVFTFGGLAGSLWLLRRDRREARLISKGSPAMATVLEVEVRVHGRAFSVLRVRLRVCEQGSEPFEVNAAAQVRPKHLAWIRAFAELPVRLDLRRPALVAIDWTRAQVPAA
jgi:hypothetical protein